MLLDGESGIESDCFVADWLGKIVMRICIGIQSILISNGGCSMFYA